MAIEELKFFTGGCPRSQISGKNLERALQNLGLDIAFEGIEALLCRCGVRGSAFA